MKLLLFALLILAPQVNAANLLFKSNFGPGVTVGAPTNFYPSGGGTGAFQHITGTDSSTGYTWPITAIGINFSGLQQITIDPVTFLNIGDYITSGINAVKSSLFFSELYQEVKIKGPVGQAGSQSIFLLQRPWTKGDVESIYISYWFRYQPDLSSKLDPTVSSGNWRVQFEFKTGGYNNTYAGDYRIATNVMKGTDGVLYWMTKADNQANGPWPRVDYWRVDNRSVPVPINEWFKYEISWKRSSGADGRFWAAVNGQVIVDYKGPNMGNYNLPVTRIMVNNAYSGGEAPVESRLTGLEIWDGFPCGVGVSCY